MALSGQQLQDAGVTDIKNMQILTPGLTVTSTTSEASTTARIRGIGTVGDNVGLESSVGVVIDGVYRPRNGVGFGDLGEIDRIEVLEGPQGELFGKNNDAGVINIVTKRPSRTFGVTGEITGGNFNDQEISGSITGPVGDSSAFRLYAGYQKRDGFLDVYHRSGAEHRGQDQQPQLLHGARASSCLPEQRRQPAGHRGLHAPQSSRAARRRHRLRAPLPGSSTRWRPSRRSAAGDPGARRFR